MALKDLALSAAEAKKDMIGYASVEGDVDNMPKYPWGTSLDLDDDTLGKLGLAKLPEVGEEVAITAVAKVTRISANEDQGGMRKCLGLQITSMEVNVPSQTASAADKLYGG